MKLEIREEFSPVYGKNMFRLYIDGCSVNSFHTEALAMKEFEKLKKAYAESAKSRVLYSEVL